MQSPVSVILGYTQTPLLPLRTPIQRFKLLLIVASAIMAAILLVHAFSPPGLSARELAIHALMVWAGFLLGMTLAALAVVIAPVFDHDQPTVGLLWLISALGFVLGILIVGAFDRIGTLAPVAAKATSLHGSHSMLLRLVPVWALATAFHVRTEILRAYESRLAAFEAPRKPRPAGDDEQAMVQLGSGKSACSVRLATILLVNAEENYCRLVIRDNGNPTSTLVRASLESVAATLPPSNFIRVHRSHVVNADHVERLRRRGRRFFVVLRGVEEDIPVSRQRYKEVVTRLEASS